MKSVLFHPEAQTEFYAAEDYYEARVRGLGDDFRQEVIAALAVVRSAPSRWPLKAHGTRSYLVHRFPFAIVYFDMPTTIWVIAVAHTSRRPAYWSARVAAPE